MRIHIETFRPDNAMDRISDAIKKRLPYYYEYTENRDEADLVIVIAYGHRRIVWKYVDRLIADGKKYIILQLNLKITNIPYPSGWMPLWKDAVFVWSYFDLVKLCKEEGIEPTFRFEHRPLGVDHELFKEIPQKRIYKIASSGNGKGWSNECKNEILKAVEGTDWRVFNIGYGVNTDAVTYSNGMPDSQLVNHYSQCEFVSGLRKKEGFELPVIEGLLCGARPICFDTPNYRQWFDGLAEFIPEDDNIASNVRKVLDRGVRPVTQAEKKYVVSKFNWDSILKPLWI